MRDAGSETMKPRRTLKRQAQVTRHRRIVVAVGVVIGLAVVSAAVSRGYDHLHRCGYHSGDQVTHRGGLGLHDECVGVTDGNFVYLPSLSDVERKIADENKWVQDQYPNQKYVTIAMLDPMTDREQLKLVMGQLRGVYLAQYQANHKKIVGDSPLIRVVLANEGTKEEEWRPTIRRLVGMTGAPDYLVAVVGLGTSIEPTEEGARELSRYGIPMIGASITANELNNKNIRGLVRVAPTNRDEVNAILAYLKGRVQGAAVHTAVLVKDQSARDSYVRTLSEGFVDRSRPQLTLVQGTETYDASLPGISNLFNQIVNAICNEKDLHDAGQRPDVVLFAGRGGELGVFLKALHDRLCTKTRIEILTGDSASEMSIDNDVRVALEGTKTVAPVTVEYAGLANLHQWQKSPNDPAAGYMEEFVRGFEQSFPRAPIDDFAIMGHDALLTAVTAARASVARQSDQIPERGEVLQHLAGLNHEGSVKGASGVIQLDQETGNPIHKLIPILQVEPSGTPDFVELAPSTS